jgi:hypothetical protein
LNDRSVKHHNRLILIGLTALREDEERPMDSGAPASKEKHQGYLLTIAYVISWGTFRSANSTG